MSGESNCKCGKRIVWAETEDGKAIPLDPTAPVYAVGEDGKARLLPLSPDGRRAAMVSHFATCRFASDFSKKGKK